MANLNVLISGAGVAGITAAHFLARAGAKVTIVERAPSLREAGQGVDIVGAGLTVARRMQVEDDIRSRTTSEEGSAVVDSDNRFRAEFPVDVAGKGLSMTREVEILRGRLVRGLYERTRQQPGLSYRFGGSIKSIARPPSGEGKAFVECERRDKAEAYDLVIGAEGE